MPEQGMDDKEYDSQQDDFSHPANITKRDRKGKAALSWKYFQFLAKPL